MNADAAEAMAEEAQRAADKAREVYDQIKEKIDQMRQAAGGTPSRQAGAEQDPERITDEASRITGAPLEGRDWNVLASRLRDGLRQERGQTPPEQYRRSIEEYFRTIAEFQEQEN